MAHLYNEIMRFYAATKMGGVGEAAKQWKLLCSRREWKWVELFWRLFVLLLNICRPHDLAIAFLSKCTADMYTYVYQNIPKECS